MQGAKMLVSDTGAWPSRTTATVATPLLLSRSASRSRVATCALFLRYFPATQAPVVVVQPCSAQVAPE